MLARERGVEMQYPYQRRRIGGKNVCADHIVAHVVGRRSKAGKLELSRPQNRGDDPQEPDRAGLSHANRLRDTPARARFGGDPAQV